MFTTTEIAPCPILSPYIRCYAYRRLDTNAIDFLMPTQARHEIVLSFHFEAKLSKIVNDKEERNLNEDFGGIVGLFTKNNGNILFNGKYAFLEVVFKPNGFYKLFRIPPKQINDTLLFAHDIFNTSINIFYEQLCHAENLMEMGFLTDTYLLSYLKQQKCCGGIDNFTLILNLISRSKGIVNIDKLAYDANMSIRTFERHFINQVGISPKLFCNISRFNHAVDLKLMHPKLKWTSIAMHCGYFDQMHLIKDFKKYSGISPSIFQNHSPLAKEDFSSRVES